jgi:hypothetical protein
LHHDQTYLHTLAKRAAAADAKGRDITKLKAMILETKAAIVLDKAAIEDHDAEHAGERVA